MSQAYYGEIKLFAGGFAPQGWAFCNGQLLSIRDYDVLFTVIGTTYGGDGQTNFALPDLQGRVPIHQGNGPGLTPRVVGDRGGAETVTITASTLPIHTHPLIGSPGQASAGAGPAGSVLGVSSVNVYGNGPPIVPMAANSVAAAGGSQPHDNMAPYLGLNYIICLFGLFPQQ